MFGAIYRPKLTWCRDCKSLIRKLLIKDEHKRLGSGSGASEVKNHKWFNNITWGLLRHRTPPVCPQNLQPTLS